LRELIKVYYININYSEKGVIIGHGGLAGVFHVLAVQVHEREQTEVEDYYQDEVESFTQDLVVFLKGLENWVFGKQVQ
jgi:hypothetical protein